jgi:hypothetical protein
MATTQQRQQVILDVRKAVTKLLDARAEVSAVRQRADDLNLLTAGPDILVDGDFTGNENGGITAATFILATTTGDTAISAADRRTVGKVRY